MSRAKVYDYTPDYAVAPGETLREAITHMGMSQVDFAQRMGFTVQSLSRILKGDQPITYDTARKLELVTGISCEFWNNLEARYREQLQLLALQEQRTQFEIFVQKFPMKELVERGYIKHSDDPVEQGMELLGFFRVGSMKAYEDYEKILDAAARHSTAYKTSPTNAVTYLNMGLHDCQDLSIAPYNERRFRQVLTQTRSMTRELPDNFSKKLKALFASAGVALVFVPPFKGVHVSGICKWLSHDRAMIILNIRGKREDRFWFSLFHEAAHLLLHKKKQIFITDNTPTDQEEMEADNYAADFLIPARYNEQIAAATSRSELIAIAKELDISKGIVAGRYQHLTKQWDTYNELILRMCWNEQSEENKEA